jgi:O-acetyl-ADP-ribose deacetylase (regulator of RNase III)
MQEIKGDLFSSDASLVHCVSQDLNMGKGIAVEFKSRFGQVDELASYNKVVGEVTYLKDTNRFIFYLITKERYWKKPTVTTLEKSLIDLKNVCLKNNIKALSMPKIGCGLDGLIWDKVKIVIDKVLVTAGIEVFVYYL